MARLEWVDQRLRNWALWHRAQQGGGLGFASQSSFLREAVDCDRYRESSLPVDEVDAGVTEQGVQSLKLDYPHLVDTLVRIYLENLGVKETARRAGRAESTIKAHLEQSDHLLARWYGERKARQALARAEVEATIQAARP